MQYAIPNISLRSFATLVLLKLHGLTNEKKIMRKGKDNIAHTYLLLEIV